MARQEKNMGISLHLEDIKKSPRLAAHVRGEESHAVHSVDSGISQGGDCASQFYNS